MKKIVLFTFFLAFGSFSHAGIEDYICPSSVACTIAGDLSSCVIQGGSSLLNNPKTLTDHAFDPNLYPVKVGTYTFAGAMIAEDNPAPYLYMCLFTLANDDSSLTTHPDQAGVYSASVARHRDSQWEISGDGHFMSGQCNTDNPALCLFTSGPFQPTGL